ncbi:isoprenoid synthase domain-containing protein [Hypomontagnella monticulosa]|nr:isoprenoid synthase domain-containing protein [Hypomontagnella monticulosa]
MDPSDIRNLLNSYLERCKLVYPQAAKHNQFEASCVAEAIRRGYIVDENDILKRYISVGVSIACNAYRHQSHDIQVFISLFTAFLTYLDDSYEKNTTQPFNHRFITGDRQNDILLDHLRDLLFEMPSMFGSVESNIITTAVLDFVTSLSIDHEFEKVKLEPSSHQFPAFVRAMSGIANAYALFIFPPELPLTWKLQVLPDCGMFINYTNDILSFYKEQLSGEEANVVSLISQCRGIGPDIALGELTDEATAAHSRVLDILAPNSVALEAYKSFSQGYVGFHASDERYRLHELGMEPTQRHT